MAYSTQTDIEKQLDQDILIQLTDDDDSGAVDAVVLAGAIADADSEIDSYCGTRYDIPLSPAPGMIRKISVDIAIYNLYGRRSMGPPENVEKRYNNAVRFLRDVSSGKVTLGASAPEPQSSSGPQSTTDKDDRVFTATTLANF
ncbi:gp436 family protein [Desulfatibacillum aliphaticivorans]|uniref:gp436 family protein n=1 Tax=Desulfatibacillum aliphaticivorans TaxID=218208 RepID=UPI000404EB06|nr:DUF1320 domain-containing protein [Desulfatibacillum aliphaticivorans]